MKKLILLFVLVTFLFKVQTFAQKNWLAGLKGGISIPHLRAPSDANGSYSNGFETVIGPQAGILAEYRFNPTFSIQTELNYSTQGGEKKGDQRIRTKDFKAYIPVGISLPDYIYATFDNKITLAYLEVPIMAKYSFKVSPSARLAVFGGPYFGYLLKAEGKARGQSKIYTDAAHTQELSYNGFPLPAIDFNRTEDIIDQLRKTNFGIQGGGSVEVSHNRYSYFMAIGGTYGFRRLQKEKNFGENETGGMTISLGIMRKL